MCLTSTPVMANVESIKARIVYNVEENKIISIAIGTDDKEISKKCSNQARSPEALALFKMQHKNYNKRLSLFYYICVI